jgi:hypothetical protein
MAKAREASVMRARKCFAKRMSDHVAFALIAYTLLLIFMVTPSLETKGTSLLPYLLLVLLVAVAIPTCRRFEHRWKVLDQSELGDNGLRTRFTFDRIKLWLGAIGVPVILALMFRSISSLV